MGKISEAVSKLYERERLVRPEWFKETRAILLKNFPCPDDTNGDGDCGKLMCPHCGVIDPSPPPPQPEVVVAERDRELAVKLWQYAPRGYASDGFRWEAVDNIIADHMATERAEAERVKAELSNAKNTVQHKHDAWQDEKKRRIYYQDIVYAVCNHLDRIFGGKTCCGTIDEPSTQVQSLMQSLVKKQSCNEDEQPYEGSPLQEINQLRTQLAKMQDSIEALGREKATVIGNLNKAESQLAASEQRVRELEASNRWAADELYRLYGVQMKACEEILGVRDKVHLLQPTTPDARGT